MRTLTSKPDTEDGPFDTEEQAEKRKDWLEVYHEMGGFEIVIFDDKYYVVYAE